MYMECRKEGGDDIDTRRWKGKGTKIGKKKDRTTFSKNSNRGLEGVGWSFSLQSQRRERNW